MRPFGKEGGTISLNLSGATIKIEIIWIPQASDPKRPESVEITLNDQKPFTVEIRWTKKHNQYRLEWNKWDKTAPTLYVPRGTSQPDISKILHKHRRWILNRKSDQMEMNHPNENSIRHLTEEKIPLNGRLLSVCWEKESHSTIVHQPEKNELILQSPEKPVACYREAVIYWVLEQYNKKITDSLLYWEGCTGLTPEKVFIRPTRSQWGSMSRRKILSLSWYLTGYSEKTLHYVILHELSHIRFPDHSTHFWTFVGRHMPEYKEIRNILRRQIRFPDWYSTFPGGKFSIRHPYVNEKHSGPVGQSIVPDLR